MAQDSASGNFGTARNSAAGLVNHYALLELPQSATEAEIRRAYREKSKLYHPDTTHLAAEVAVEKFRQLNQAYAVLSSPEQRQRYDKALLDQTSHSQVFQGGLPDQSPSRATASSPPPSKSGFRFSRSAYLEAQDRPLSSGEVFALFILALTFLGCLLLAILVGMMRGEIVVAKLQQLHPQEWLTQIVSQFPHPETSQPHGSATATPTPVSTPTLQFRFSLPHHE